MRLIPPALSLGCLILSSTCLAQTLKWVQVKPKTSPGPRGSHGMAHDFIRSRTIIFGGGSGTSKGNETWEYDGANWTRMNPRTTPSRRRQATMVFHFASFRTLMFGGEGIRSSSSPNLNDTWTWDGKDWTQLRPKTSPPARGAHGMAYDSGRQRTVLFGGIGANSNLNDTWEWDGVNWTQVKTKSSPPAGVASLAYDSGRKRVVLFGGLGTGPHSQTWEYDGKDWTRMTPTTSPSARCCVGLAYDMARQRTVMFGGGTNSATVADTWEYDGKNWALMNSATKPPTRYDFDMMVYDQRRRRMVIFGGTGGIGQLGDTWEYNAPQSLSGSPPTISIASGGTHTFGLQAGTANANRLYWIFGSFTGFSPGVTLASAVGSVRIPLNPDVYTDITIAMANTPLLTNTRGTLDGSGKATATLNVPKTNITALVGLKFHHAYLVYDAKNNFYMVSDRVELTLVK